MIIETKYNIDDNVLIHLEEESMCGCCGGSRVVPGLDGQEYPCAVCISPFTPSGPRKAVITKVRVDVCSSGPFEWYKYEDEYGDTGEVTVDNITAGEA